MWILIKKKKKRTLKSGKNPIFYRQIKIVEYTVNVFSRTYVKRAGTVVVNVQLWILNTYVGRSAIIWFRVSNTVYGTRRSKSFINNARRQ